MANQNHVIKIKIKIKIVTLTEAIGFIVYKEYKRAVVFNLGYAKTSEGVQARTSYGECKTENNII
jgi:hypothetical protein